MTAARTTLDWMHTHQAAQRSRVCAWEGQCSQLAGVKAGGFCAPIPTPLWLVSAGFLQAGRLKGSER